MDKWSVIYESRWAFLQPWVALLAGRLEIFSPDSVVGPVYQELTLVVELPESSPTPAELSAIRDAVVLLALAKRVGKWAWEHVLPAYCGVEERDVVESKSGFFPAFTVSLDGRKWKVADLDLAVESLCSFFSGDPSREGHVFSAEVEKIASSTGVDLAGSMDIPVTLAIRTFGRQGAASKR